MLEMFKNAIFLVEKCSFDKTVTVIFGRRESCQVHTHTSHWLTTFADQINWQRL
jgi:hypothetical protein